MPELPDVEMTRRDLKRWLVGAIATAADTEDARLSRPASPRAFAHALVGRTLRAHRPREGPAARVASLDIAASTNKCSTDDKENQS
jgi:hypothetical protein